MKITRIGVDLAKNVFQLHGICEDGQTVWKRKLPRAKWIGEILKKIEPGAEIGMEACSGAHHWARLLIGHGYKVKIIPPQFVKPFVKSNKNDANDAQAICEAMARPNMHPVQVKTIEQQDYQALIRIREEAINQRKSKGNQIRGLVAEYGLVAPRQVNNLRKQLPDWIEDASNGLSIRFRELLISLQDDFILLDNRIKSLNKQVEQLSSSNELCEKLQQVSGIGPLISLALFASVNDGKQYKNGRSMAAALGLTPRQKSSGGKNILLGISKRGDSYLRSILVHGARTVVSNIKDKDDKFSCWIRELSKRKHTNVVVVAVANKLARHAWAIMTRGEAYDRNYVPRLV